MAARVLKLKDRRQVNRVGASAPSTEPAIRLATLVARRDAESVWLEWSGRRTRVAARLAVAADSFQLDAAIEARRQVVVALANDGPLVIGVVGLMPAPQPKDGAFVVEADADGQRVRLIAKEEVILQCGEASLTLKRNGRVVIRGSYVETQATGTNRIKGGYVRIN